MKAEPSGLVNEQDTSLKKMEAACALIFDVKCSKQVELQFFDMCSTTGENALIAGTFFQSIQNALNKDDVSWSNCVRFGVDNCNTNVGARNKCCFIAGCLCHTLMQVKVTRLTRVFLLLM